MSDPSKKTPVTVEVNVDTSEGTSQVTDESQEAQGASQPQDRAATFRASGAQARKLASKTRASATGWVEGLAPGHSNAVIFGVLGVLVALLIFWLGFFQALFIALMATAGVAFGQWLDGDPRIINGIKHLLAPSNDYRY